MAVGPWYILPDEFLVSGEATARNLLIGRRQADALGGVQHVGYLPDSFGHIAQMPQILKGFNIRSFIFSRGMGPEIESLGTEFWWEAPDGTRVLANFALRSAILGAAAGIVAVFAGGRAGWAVSRFVMETDFVFDQAARLQLTMFDFPLADQFALPGVDRPN